MRPTKRNARHAPGGFVESEKHTNRKHTAFRHGTDGARPFVVTYQKSSGAVREYGRYADRAEADRVCGLLRWAGSVATVEAVA